MFDFSSEFNFPDESFKSGLKKKNDINCQVLH